MSAAWNKILQHAGLRRFFVFLIIAVVFYLFRGMINLILLTFIFTFLMDRLETAVRSFLNRFLNVSQKMVITSLYIALGGVLAIGIINYYPVVEAQIKQLIELARELTVRPEENIPFYHEFTNVFGDINISGYMEEGFNFLYTYLTDISSFSLQVLLSLILSMFFLIEKDRLTAFMQKFKTSKLSLFYFEIAFFSKKFVQTFGKVLEAQFIIALVNCTLTTIALWIMGFPQLFGLAIMVFFLGLIPVAGVVLSLIPLSIIAFNIGGWIYVLYMFIVIMIIHAIEAYFLNPKLMSAKTELPIFFTFIILIFSEHYFGIWGLIIGIPVVVFLLDVLDVTNSNTNEEKAIGEN